VKTVQVIGSAPPAAEVEDNASSLDANVDANGLRQGNAGMTRGALSVGTRLPMCAPCFCLFFSIPNSLRDIFL